MSRQGSVKSLNGASEADAESVRSLKRNASLRSLKRKSSMRKSGDGAAADGSNPRSRSRADDSDLEDSDSGYEYMDEELGGGQQIFELTSHLNAIKASGRIRSARERLQADPKAAEEAEAKKRHARELERAIRRRRGEVVSDGEDGSAAGASKTTAVKVAVPGALRGDDASEELTSEDDFDEDEGLHDDFKDLDDITSLAIPDLKKRATPLPTNGLPIPEEEGDGEGSHGGSSDADDSDSSTSKKKKDKKKKDKKKKDKSGKSSRRSRSNSDEESGDDGPRKPRGKVVLMSSFPRSKLFTKNQSKDKRRVFIKRPEWRVDDDGVESWDESLLYKVPDVICELAPGYEREPDKLPEYLRSDYDCIWLAAKRGDLAAVQRFIRAGAKVNDVDKRDVHKDDKCWLGNLFLQASKSTAGDSALYWACVMGKYEVASFLLERGAKDKDAVVCDATKDRKILDLLKAHGFKPTEQVDPEDMTEEEREKYERRAARRKEASRTHKVGSDSDETGSDRDAGKDRKGKDKSRSSSSSKRDKSGRDKEKDKSGKDKDKDKDKDKPGSRVPTPDKAADRRPKMPEMMERTPPRHSRTARMLGADCIGASGFGSGVAKAASKFKNAIKLKRDR